MESSVSLYQLRLVAYAVCKPYLPLQKHTIAFSIPEGNPTKKGDPRASFFGIDL